jgi:hypothetical protein
MVILNIYTYELEDTVSLKRARTKTSTRSTHHGRYIIPGVFFGFFWQWLSLFGLFFLLYCILNWWWRFLDWCVHYRFFAATSPHCLDSDCEEIRFACPSVFFVGNGNVRPAPTKCHQPAPEKTSVSTRTAKTRRPVPHVRVASGMRRTNGATRALPFTSTYTKRYLHTASQWRSRIIIALPSSFIIIRTIVPIVRHRHEASASVILNIRLHH